MNSVTFASTSKTFNLAGLFTGHAIIPNQDLLKKYNQALEATGAGMGNIFGYEAVKAAYTPKGEQWLEEAMEYIQEDEYVEVTPKAIRMRKIILDENERKRWEKSAVGA